MERSIENIWKTGFESENELLAPKVAKLYRKKSKLVIERLKRSFKIDNAGLPIVGVLILAKTYYDGNVWLGVYFLVLSLALFFINRRQYGKLQRVQLTDDLYHYLISCRATLRKMIRFYTRLVAIGVPLVAIPAIYFFQDQKQPGVWQDVINISPWLAVTVLVLFVIILSALGICVYYLSTGLIYGRLLKKLDEMIADLEQLSSRM